MEKVHHPDEVARVVDRIKMAFATANLGRILPGKGSWKRPCTQVGTKWNKE
jgi:hypothetical protein